MKIVILAGGSGTRLWPLSREAFPKQCLKLGGGESLLQKTIRRFLPECDVKDIFIVTNREILFLIKRQIGEIEPRLVDQILVEPERKNTGPAIAFAMQQIENEEIVLVCSSDHWIEPKDQFLAAVKTAEAVAREDRIVLFGIQPNKPETGYGYVEVKRMGEVFDAISFKEKPSLAVAEKYLSSGNYVWNSGMFAFSGKTFWEEIAVHCPELLGPFEAMPSISIDYALMEKSKKIAVVPLKAAWSDIGTWDAMYDAMDKDGGQNVTMGNILTIATQNSLIIGEKRLIVAAGLENALIVETEDALYVGKRNESQKVKEIVETLRALGKSEVKEHRTVHRPWGSYTVLEEGPRYKVKRIFVAPFQKLSLQMHSHRSEHWVVVKGQAVATIGEVEAVISENESTYIPISTVHRLENPRGEPLELIEVQVGDYVGEDDIIRFEDIYGRVEQLLATSESK